MATSCGLFSLIEKLEHREGGKMLKNRDRLRYGAMFLAGCGVGAFSMYLVDPARGARRRAYIRDKFVHAGRTVADRADKQARNLANHVKGALYEIRAKLTGERRPDDDV